MKPLKSLLCALFTVVLMFASASLTFAAPSQNVSYTGLFYYPSGKTTQFVVKLIIPRDGEYWYYYRSRPVQLNDQAASEWLSSYVNSIWEKQSVTYEVFAWGQVNGGPAELADRLVLQIGTTTQKIVPTRSEENQIARIVCATAETGRNVFGIPAYRKWANISEENMQEWQPLFAHLATSERRNDFRRGGRDLDLYSVFTGISAIRETLQSDVEIGDRPAEMDRRCAASQRVIQGAVEMYNMDSEKAMEELDMDVLLEKKYLKERLQCHSGRQYYGRDLAGNGVIRCPLHGDPNNPQPDAGNEADLEKSVRADSLAGPNAPSHPWATMIKNPSMKLPEVYAMIPGDCAFIHFPSYSVFRKSFDFFDDWATAIGSLAGGDVGGSNFNLEKSIKDQLQLKTDMLTRLFADLALSDIVFVCEDPFVFEGTAFAVMLKITNEAMLREKLAMTAAEFCTDNPSIKNGTESISGREVQTFISEDFRFRSYRLKIADQMIICNSPVLMKKLIETADKKVSALTAQKDLQYFYEHMHAAFPSADRVFSFLSDAFIRKLIGPAFKIAAKRRLECVRSALLQTHEVMLNGRLSPDHVCPDGGVYSFVDGEIRCSEHRAFGRMQPLSERLPVELTAAEASGYERFVSQYNQYFRQFFDPIGLVFTTEPDFRARLLIMPLVENGVYSELQKNLRHEPMKAGPQLKNGILKIGANLKAETLPVPGYWYESATYARRLDIARRCLTGCVWAHLADHQLLFHWDSNLLARGILDSFGGGRPGEFAALTPGILSFFSPVLFSFELTDRSHYQTIISAIQREIEESSSMSGFLSPEFSLERLEENGVSMYVLSFELFAIKKTYYLTEKDGFLLFASRKDLLFELTEAEETEKVALNGNFNLFFYPQHVQLMRSDLLESRARSQRKACCENLKNLSFVNAFKSEEVLKYYQLIYSALPLCPAGGQYSTSMPAACSVHGSIADGALKTAPGFFDSSSCVSVQTFIRPEGLQTELLFMDR